MTPTKTLSLAAGALLAASLFSTGCASSSDDSAPGVRPSATQVPPSSPDSESSPTAGSANADPHGFTQ